MRTRSLSSISARQRLENNSLICLNLNKIHTRNYFLKKIDQDLVILGRMQSMG